MMQLAEAGMRRVIGVLAFFLVIATALPTPAQAVVVPSTGWAWVTARHPTTASYTPARRDQGNSAGMTNTVQRTDVGTYNVTIPGMGVVGNDLGTAIVTALGPKPRFCTVFDMGRQSTTEGIYVRCYAVDGVQADSKFSLVYSASGSDTGTQAYLFTYGSEGTDYTPDLSYQFNSTAVANTIHHPAAGVYEVSLPGMSASEGNLQVTTASDGFCRVTGWADNSGTLVATVNCWNVVGSLSDEAFDLMYTDGVGTTGVSRPHAAYLFASKPTKLSYTPPAGYLYSTGSSPTIKRRGKGSYVVTLPGMTAGGAASVTAVGTGKSRCQLGSISTRKPQKVSVLCFNVWGAPVDSQFTFSYTK
jgi:hypothetical protein